MATISELQAQIQTLEAQKDEINAKEPLDTDALNLVNNKLSELNYELEQLQAAQQAEQAKQERVETAAKESAAAVDELKLDDDITLRDVVPDETTYQFLTIAIKSMLQAKDTNYINEIAEIQRAASEREANLTYQLKQASAQIDEKEAQISEISKQNNDLKSQVNTLTFERDEALKVRDNAAAEIEGYKMAVEEKQKQIDTLRSEIAIGAKAAVQIDQTEQLKLAKEAWMASRIKVTNIRWTDEIQKKEYAAELVLDTGDQKAGDTITFNRLEKGKYLEVTAEEAARFRAEAQQATATAETSSASSENSVQDTALVTTEVQPVESVPTFQTEVQPVAGLDTSGTTEVVQPTLEERVAILEKKVAELETVCA